MKSLSVGDETGDLAEPRCVSERVKNRNPTVPCWLSFMAAALVTKLVASEPLPLQLSIPPPSSPLLFILVRFSFTLFSFPARSHCFFHCLISFCLFFYPFDFSLHTPLLLTLSALCFCPFTPFNFTPISPHVSQVHKTTAHCCCSPESLNICRNTDQEETHFIQALILKTYLVTLPCSLCATVINISWCVLIHMKVHLILTSWCGVVLSYISSEI